MKPKYRYFVVEISSGANGAPTVLTQRRLPLPQIGIGRGSGFTALVSTRREKSDPTSCEPERGKGISRAFHPAHLHEIPTRLFLQDIRD